MSKVWRQLKNEFFLYDMMFFVLKSNCEALQEVGEYCSE